MGRPPGSWLSLHTNPHARETQTHSDPFLLRQGHKELLQILIARGADMKIRDKHGNVAKTLASKKGFDEIVTILEAAEKTQARAKSKVN